MEKLIANQQKFVDEYLIDRNATRAYRAAYPYVTKDETAAAAGSRLLRNVRIQGYLSKRMRDREKRTEVTQDKVVQELANIAFAKATDFVRVRSVTGMYQGVEVINTDDIPPDKQSAIASIKQGANGIEIKLHDKPKALELLGRHLGMFNDKLEVTGVNNNPFAELTTEELKKLIWGD